VPALDGVGPGGILGQRPAARQLHQVGSDRPISRHVHPSEEYRVRGHMLRSDMTASSFNPRALLSDARLGVLATIKANGLPQLSPVTPFYDQAADVVYVSMTEGRAKTANLRRDPRAALEVTSADGWSWATAEGAVTLTGPGTDPQSPEVEALVDYYRNAAGEHPDWDEYRSVMVSDRRVLMALTIDRVYGESIR
jgi:PPOX class probable F420-dependent enzyme